MDNRSLKGIRIVVTFTLFFISLSGFLRAQYHVYSWNNFEKGSFPQDLIRTHDATSMNVVVIDYSSIGSLPGAWDEIAKRECGQYGVKFHTIASEQFLKAVNPATLDRKNLGNKGKALYQADFYLPAQNTEIPYSMAVLAVLPPTDDQGGLFSFYRLAF